MRAAERAMGFCLFDNVAIAAAALRPSCGLERVAIVDWDVHHGNGTEAIFRDDPTVFFVVAAPVAVLSGHRRPRRPGARRRSTSRSRPARATTNTSRAFERVVEPAVARFEPELYSSPPASTRTPRIRSRR